MGAGWEIGTALAGAGMGIASGIQNLFAPGIQREREDSAIQRAVADAKAAGINPILMAGNPAQSTPIQTRAGDTGALVDYMSKKAAVDLQAEQQELVKQNKYNAAQQAEIYKPQVREAQHRFGTLVDMMDPTSGNIRSNEYYLREKGIIEGEQQSRLRAATLAKKYGVPIEMLSTSAGQTLMMNEMLSTAPPKDKIALLGIMAAQSGMAASAISPVKGK